MRREVMLLRTILASPNMDRGKLKEYLIRLMYVEMLGHDASFGYIHAVKATVEHDLAMKRVGYLATSAFLDENHELIILLVNTVQQDLRSDNYLVVCAALTTVCRLVNEETIPAVLPQVTELLSHPKELVRKKAVMALHRFHQRSPSSVSHLQSKFRQMLCDKDPSVMSAALCALHDLIVSDPVPHKNLITSFVSILKQIVEHRLPKSYDYHRVPAPFVQIKLLKILAVLGAADKAASSEMYAVLSLALKKADNQGNIGNAIVYECVKTAAAIYPSSVLLEHCASVVSRFVQSRNNNIKYVGLDALSRVVNINPKYANEHQMAVVDCLTDPDESLRKKTMDLLYRMTKSHNVEVIVEKMVEFLEAATDAHTREETVGRIGELAERYAPNTRWFIDTMNTLFAIGGDVVKPALAHDLIRLFGEGTGDDAADAATRATAARTYLDLVKTPKLSKPLLEVIIWVLGEYGPLSGETAANLQDALCDAVETQPNAEADATQARAMSALGKLAAADGGRLSEKSARWLARMANSRSVDKQQRAHEILALLRESPATVAAAMPRDASAEELDVDPALPELEALVADAVARGASAYRTPAERAAAARAQAETQQNATARSDAPAPAQVPAAATAASLRFDAYGAPQDPGGAFAPESSSFGAALHKREGAWGPAAASGGADAAGSPADDERARLAGALFGGGSAAAAAAAPPPAAPPPPPPPPRASDMDLLMGLDAPAGSGAGATSAPAGPAPDLLGGLEQLSVGGAPAAMPGFPPAVGPGAAFDLLGPLEGQQQPGPGLGARGATGGATRSPGASTIPAHLRDRTALKKKDPFADLMG